VGEPSVRQTDISLTIIGETFVIQKITRRIEMVFNDYFKHESQWSGNSFGLKRDAVAVSRVIVSPT